MDTFSSIGFSDYFFADVQHRFIGIENCFVVFSLLLMISVKKDYTLSKYPLLIELLLWSFHKSVCVMHDLVSHISKYIFVIN